MEPVKALINLVGYKETTHDEVSKLIKEGLESHIWKKNAGPTYAEPLYKIQSLDLPSRCPRKRKQQNMEIGYIKQDFFDDLGSTKPAVTIFLFDWRKWAESHPKTEVFDWKAHEALILNSVKQHGDAWQRDLSVPSKFMIIILLPTGLPQPVNLEEIRTSFKKAVQASGDENIKSNNYFLTNGFEGIKTQTGMLKKFSKNLHELVVAYYREKKQMVKRKQKKLIGGQIQHVRYSLKLGIYSLLTSHSYPK